MLIKFAAGGMGIGIPKINTQVSGLLECFVYICDPFGQGAYMHIGKSFSFNRNNSTIGFAGIETKWTLLDNAKDRWLFNPWLFAKGHTGEVVISSGSMLATRVDINLRVFHDGRLKHQVIFSDLEAEGSQFSDLNIRGGIHVQRMAPAYLKQSSNQMGAMR